MPAAYDTYDYPSYWEEREYEHKSEVIALKNLLGNIQSIHTVLDIGAGFGRLTPVYYYRAKKLILADPSARLLKIAKEKTGSKKAKFVHSGIENLDKRIRTNIADLVILVRVIHHLKDLDKAFSVISKLIKKKGYLILEFPNKRHIKEITRQLFKGNFTYLLDIAPKDLRSRKHIKANVLPFKNYHPDFIKELLVKYDFKIVKTISVSNLRYSWIKDNLPLEFVLFIEKWIQNLFSLFNPGPSIFVLAKKK